jgi:hypothetical protein
MDDHNIHISKMYLVNEHTKRVYARHTCHTQLVLATACSLGLKISGWKYCWLIYVREKHCWLTENKRLKAQTNRLFSFSFKPISPTSALESTVPVSRISISCSRAWLASSTHHCMLSRFVYALTFFSKHGTVFYIWFSCMHRWLMACITIRGGSPTRATGPCPTRGLKSLSTHLQFFGL